MNMLDLLRRPKAPQAPPGQIIYAVGDIHGRADLLEKLLARIRADHEGADGAPTLVFVGDYVDRGLQSRQVVETILNLPAQGYETHCLIGNHESALLDFMDRPETGPFWFALGGAETLFSYGVSAPSLSASHAELRLCAQALRAAMPPAHLRFFVRLDLHVRLGDYLFVHAGLRPGRDLAAQTREDMLQIRQPFLKARGRWPFVVVHGHTPVEDVVHDGRRIAIDTGAYATGKLSCVRLEGESLRILTT